jgi:hypothetical protein
MFEIPESIFNAITIVVVLAVLVLAYLKLDSQKGLAGAKSPLDLLRSVGLNNIIDTMGRRHIVFYHPQFKYLTIEENSNASTHTVNASANNFGIINNKYNFGYDNHSLAKYNFNKAGAELIFGKSNFLEDELRFSEYGFSKIIKKAIERTRAFMVEHGIEGEATKVLPLILILADDPILIKKALEVEISPAILAEIIHSKKLPKSDIYPLLLEYNAYKDLPISWVSQLYELTLDKRNL